MAQRQIFVAGPVAPFRGGIARHTGALVEALRRLGPNEVHVESFASLYPSLLYPGQSDRDGSIPPFLGARFSLNTINPMTWLRLARKLTPGALLVIPAWTFFVAPALGTIARLARRKGATVIMVIHNVEDHDGRSWKFRFSRWQLAAADGFITHTDALKRDLDASFSTPVVVAKHPSYTDFPPAAGSLPQRASLELLCFGLVRRYKGVEIALKALARSARDDVRLTIAGEIWENRDELMRLASLPQLHGKVEIIDRYVSDDEAAELFARCDAVLAPYLSVSGSGVLAMAQHYRRPVIASDLPGFAEVIEDGVNGFLVSPGNVEGLATRLNDDITRASCERMRSACGPAASDGGWGEYARAVLGLADGLTDKSRR